MESFKILILRAIKNTKNTMQKKSSLFNLPSIIAKLEQDLKNNQFVKHKLKAKYYLRYVDDFVIIAENPQILNDYLQQIALFLNQTLKLTLNSKKTILQPCSHGINFLGYIVRKNYFLVRNRTIKSFKRYLYFINHLINPIKFPIINLPHNSLLVKSFRNKEIIAPITLNAITLKKILATINSYYGIFCFANSFNLRVSLYVNHFHALKDHFLPQNKKFDSLKIKNLKNIAI